MGFEQTDTPELKLEKLKASLSQAVEPTDEDIFLYAELLSTATPERERSLSLTPQRQKDLTIAALSRHLRHLADKQPLIIVLADAHWIDSSTLDLVNRIIPLIKTARVLFLIEFRQEFIPQWLDESHVTMLRLERMGHEQSLAIISEVTGDKKLPPELQEQIISKADGVPLFIEELTKSVQESELVQDVGDKYVATGPLNSLAVPTSLVDSLTARLDRLGAAKEVAQIGAVIGREFSHALLAAVASQSANSLQAALAQLASFGVDLHERRTSRMQLTHSSTRWCGMPRTRHCRGSSGSDSTAASPMFSKAASPRRSKRNPSCWRIILRRPGLPRERSTTCERLDSARFERSANAEAIGHLTRALELLQSSHDSLQRKRAQFPLEAMLSQAMIARYGYAAPRTRETLLRARTHIDELTNPSHKFSVLYGIWASHYVAAEVAKQRSAAAEFLTEAERTRDTAMKCIGAPTRRHHLRDNGRICHRIASPQAGAGAL